jgi:hypothetical protein
VTIGDYLVELERELSRRRAPRARLLREAAEHLRDLAEEFAGEVPREQAEARAVRQFGAAATVAARFALATASTAARRAVAATAAAFVAYAGVYVAFATAASPLLRDFPQGAPTFFALQLAGVALVVASVRSLRWRRELAAPAAELTAIGRAVALATVALVAAVGGEAAVALSRPAGVVVWNDGRWLTLAFTGVLVVSLLAALASARAAAQAQAVDALPREARAALRADDVDELLRRARLAALARSARALLAHPWLATVAIAALAFVTVIAVGVAGSGASALVGAAVLGAVEASLIVVCFAAFGGLLGLRAGTRAAG